MSYIFIAHVEEDAEIALGIALSLEEAGYRTWSYELDSIPGTSYIVRTGEAVEQSQAVVVVISPNSIGSSQVTKEVVRAHESAKHFIPILSGITHAEFQNRQPEWREAIGSATSIRITKEGVAAIIPLIIDGIKSLGIHPSAKTDAARIDRIRRALDEIQGRPPSPEGKVFTTKPREEIKKAKSKRPVVIISAFVVVIAIVVMAVFFLPGMFEGKDGTPDSELSPPESEPISTPAPTSTLAPTSTPTATPASTPTPTPSPSPAPALSPKPDLTILDISWSPENPRVGDTITFAIAVSNKGNQKVSDPYVYFYVDGKYIESGSIYQIPSGETAKIYFRWEAQLGTHKIKVVADDTNVVSESDETNNEMEITLPEPLFMDLIVQDITWTPTNPQVDEQVTFMVTIKNQGNGMAGQFYVNFYVDGGYAGQLYNVDKLYAGETTTAIFYWYKAKSGTHNIKLVADYKNTVPESDETNNSKTVTLVLP